MLNSDANGPSVMVAPNGARRTKQDHPALPLSVDEIVAEAQACHAAGAHALHLHVRDGHGQHSLDPAIYRAALAALSEAAPNLAVQITTEAAGKFDVATQVSTVERLQPAAASVSVREMVRAPRLAKRIYDLCHDQGTQIQHIVYDLDDLHQLIHWREAGVVHANQTDCLLVLGQYQPARHATASDIETLIQAQSALDGRWMVCAFGPQEHDVLLGAAACGADLRIGFENNLHAPDGTLATSNADNVATLKAALDAHTTPKRIAS